MRLCEERSVERGIVVVVCCCGGIGERMFASKDAPIVF